MTSLYWSRSLQRAGNELQRIMAKNCEGFNLCNDILDKPLLRTCQRQLAFWKGLGLYLLGPNVVREQVSQVYELASFDLSHQLVWNWSVPWADRECFIFGGKCKEIRCGPTRRASDHHWRVCNRRGGKVRGKHGRRA